LSRGHLLRDDVTCVYVDGEPRPRLTAADILASDVQAVEVYGIFARGGTMAPPSPWLMGTFCGTGTRQGPLGDPERMPSERTPRTQDGDNIARVIVVWMKRRR
jgi:hypothetical protein